MFAALLSLAATHIAGLAGGAALGGAIEVAVPFLTKAHKIRKAVNLARTVHRRIHGRDLTEPEIREIYFDPTITR